MSFLGLRTIDAGPGGFDEWAFNHARHHDSVTTALNVPVTFTANTQLNSSSLTSLSISSGLYAGMGLIGTGIPLNTTITAFDPIGLTITMSNPASANGTGVSITAAFQPLTFYILNPINRSDPQQFLFDHQQSHNAINGALGQAGNDLQDVNLQSREEIDAWLDLDFTEHQTWLQITGVD